ncbi:MAG: hypothetical protein ACRCU5_07210, partial [Rhizobiaceae bacterium]
VLGGFGDTPETQTIDSQIEAINAEYEQRRLAILSNTQLTEDARTALEMQLSQRRIDQIGILENQKTNMILSSGAQLFGNLAGLAKAFGGEQSKAYKVMFAVSKAFAISQGIMNLSTAISNASALPYPANMPAMAQAATVGMQLIGDIKGAAFQGQAHDGIGYVPGANEGTWLLKKGEMVMNNQQRDNFEQLVKNTDAAATGTNAGGTTVNITNNITIDARGAAEGSQQAISDAMDAATRRIKQEIAEDFSNGGPLLRQVRGGGMAA